jgi:alkylhydroperoxidase family enzyme
MSEATTDRDEIPPSRTLVFRAGLWALAAIQAIDGVYALLAPRSFYDDFPLGRGWVAALPGYSEHLVRDVGSLFLATAVVLAAAAIFLGRRLVIVALVSFLTFSVPHFIYHLFNLDVYATGDVIANVFGLAATVVIPIGLLWLLAQPEPAAASTAAAKPSGAGGWSGRIEPVPTDSRNPVVRYAFRESRKQAEGEVMDPVRVFAHHPKLMFGYGTFEMATERSKLVPERIKVIAELRAAMAAGCEWCLDYASSISAANGVDEEDLRALPVYETSDRFSDLEKLVLDYATGMSRTPVDVSDELFSQLAEHFSEAQLVELTSVIALENYRARFNWAFGLAGQGFSEGAYCVRPEPGAGNEPVVATDAGGSAAATAPAS